MPPSFESARQEWEEGYRRVQAEAGDHELYLALMEQVDAVRDELRRRVGQTFTLSELDGAYRDADTWIRETVREVRRVSLIGPAAFYLYSRGASDYKP